MSQYGTFTRRPGLGVCLEFRAERLAAVRQRLKRSGQAHALAAQTGHFKTGFKRRELALFQRAHVRANALRLPPAARDRLRAQTASFLGHCRHASAGRVWQRTLVRFPWLATVFDDPASARRDAPLRPAWAAATVSGLAGQYKALSRLASLSWHTPGAACAGQDVVLPASAQPTTVGCAEQREAQRTANATHPSAIKGGDVAPPASAQPTSALSQYGAFTRRPGLGDCLEFRAERLAAVRQRLDHSGQAHALAAQTGHFKTGFKRRELVLLWRPPGAAVPSFLSTFRRGVI